MFFVVFFLFTPTAKNVVPIIRQMQQNPQQPPPAEFSMLQKRLAMIPLLGVTLLLLAEVFMVGKLRNFKWYINELCQAYYADVRK